MILSRNMTPVLLIIFVFSVYGTIGESRLLSTKDKEENIVSDKEINNPLFLTPLIEEGNITQARKLSRCGILPNAPPFESYSGLITVNKNYNSNIFFWFFPAENKDPHAPLLLWLQGGPGLSAFFGLFLEHGPYVIHKNMTATLREYHWARTFNLLYVENPVGTGYSFTDDDQGYVNDENEMADDMFEFLQQFFTLFPEYRDNDFYIAGESYAGKFVPSLANKIHTMGSAASMNLQGMAIGNGMCDPESMLNYSDYLYNIGLIDEIQAETMSKLSELILQDIRNENYLEAVIKMDKLIIDLNIFNYTSLFKSFTGFDFYYNFLMSKEPDDFKYYEKYIQHPQFRTALHVGYLPYQDGKLAKRHLLLDIMKSAKENVTTIMNNYRVLIYNGQLDIIIPYPLTLNFIKSIDWKYSEEYKKTSRKIWRLDNNTDIAGYVRNIGDFYEILVRNAGHILPYDQPEIAFDLISRFLFKKTYA